MKRREHGLSRLEFAIVAGIFAVLIGVFLHAVRLQQEQAEKLAMEINLMSLRTALMTEVADRLIHDRAMDTKDLVGSNPVRFLENPPPGYLGEFKDVDPSRLPRASWYFDRGSGELVYLANVANGLKRMDGSGKAEIRWKIQPRDKQSRNNPTVDALSLLPTAIFEWF